MESSHDPPESAPERTPFTSDCDDDLGAVAPDTIDFTTATSTSPRVDITRVATEHLLKLKDQV